MTHPRPCSPHKPHRTANNTTPSQGHTGRSFLQCLSIQLCLLFPIPPQFPIPLELPSRGRDTLPYPQHRVPCASTHRMWLIPVIACPGHKGHPTGTPAEHLVCAECAQSHLFGVAAGPKPHGVPLAPGGVPGRWELFSALGTAWDVSKSGALVHVHGDGGASWIPSPGSPAGRGEVATTRCPARALTRGHRDRHQDTGTGTRTRHRDRPWEPVPPQKGTRGTVLAVFLQSPCPRVCSTGDSPNGTAPGGPTPLRPPPAPSPSGALGAQPAPAFANTASPPSPPRPLPPQPGEGPGRPAPPPRTSGCAGSGGAGGPWDGTPGAAPPCFDLRSPGNALAGRGAEPGGVPLPAATARQEGSGGAPAAPPFLPRTHGACTVRAPRSGNPWRDHAKVTAAGGSGALGGSPTRESRPAGPRGPHHRGGHTQLQALPWGGGDAPRPHPAPRPPGRGAPPNRFHRGLPAPHGGPSPPSAPAEPRGSPVPSEVRQGEAQPGLPVRLPVSVSVATPGGGGGHG